MDDREKIREAINRLENLLQEDEWGDVSFELDRLYAALNEFAGADPYEEVAELEG